MPEPDYIFPPRRTNGVIGRLGIGHLLSIVIGIALPWLGIQLHSIVAFVLLLILGIGVVALSFQRLGGRYITDWVKPVAGAVISAVRGTGVYRGAIFGPNSLQHRMDLPGDLAGLRMISAPNPDGQTRVGLCLDERGGTVTAALLTQGTPIVLEESAEQQARLDEWESVMESTCDADTAIIRFQLLFRSMPDSTNVAQQYYLDRATDRESMPAEALRELVSRAAPAAQRHEVFVVVALSLEGLAADIKASGGDDEAIGVVVVERLIELQRQIMEARIPVQGWLSPEHYAAVIHTQFDPDSLPLYDARADDRHQPDPRTAGPSATERQWQAYVHDSGMSSTVWVHELPRRPVKANWLSPLLQQGDVRRSITLVVEPLDTARAERSINHQKLAAAGSIYVKQRHGLIVDSRTEKELTAAHQLDDELASGAWYFRYHMFVAITASDMDKLRRSVTAVRRRLTRIRCMSMVLYGEQDQAFFAAALPLARGLAPMRGLTGS
jgi:hypothetical protein